MLQPPFGLLAQPPLESVNKLGRIGNRAGASLVADLPLFVPAAFINGLLDAADVLVVANGGQASFPQALAFGGPACWDQSNCSVVVAFDLLPEAERALRLTKGFYSCSADLQALSLLGRPRGRGDFDPSNFWATSFLNYPQIVSGLAAKEWYARGDSNTRPLAS
jgi:hypothetical protein